MRYFLGLLTLIVLMTACVNRGPTENGPSPNVKRYRLKGKVVAVDREKKRARIDHEAIEGFMEAMTMDFPIQADWVWDNLTPGSEVRAELVVDSSATEPYWLENVGIISAGLPGREASQESSGQIGKQIVDF